MTIFVDLFYDFHFGQRMSKKLSQTFAICCPSAPIEGSAELDFITRLPLPADFDRTNFTLELIRQHFYKKKNWS